VDAAEVAPVERMRVDEVRVELVGVARVAGRPELLARREVEADDLRAHERPAAALHVDDDDGTVRGQGGTHPAGDVLRGAAALDLDGAAAPLALARPRVE